MQDPSTTSNTHTNQNDTPRTVASILLISTYTLAILGAELLGAYLNPLLAIIFHSLLLIGLIAHSVTQHNEATRRLLLVLAMLPLLRIVSMTVITSLVPTVYLYVIAAIPIATAIVLIAHLHGLTWATLGMRRVAWQPELLVALSGLPLSLIGYWFLQPASLISRWEWPPFIIAAFILIVFGAMVEEILFRGLLQHTAIPHFGNLAFVYSSFLYAIAFSSWQSTVYMVAALLLGLYFGWWVKRSQAVWGVIAAHSIINIGMFLIWPYVF